MRFEVNVGLAFALHPLHLAFAGFHTRATRIEKNDFVSGSAPPDPRHNSQDASWAWVSKLSMHVCYPLWNRRPIRCPTDVHKRR